MEKDLVDIFEEQDRILNRDYGPDYELEGDRDFSAESEDGDDWWRED